MWRSLPWRALAGAGALGLLLAGTTRLPDRAPGDGLGWFVLRLTALAGALGLAFLLDDPARNTSATTPFARPARTVLRLVLITPLTVLWWTAAVLLIPAPTRPPLGPATLEAAAMAALALALATTAVRFTDTAETGRGTATWLTIAAAVTVLVPERWGLLGLPGEPYWVATQVRWAAVLGVTAALSALWTPEPLRGLFLRGLSTRGLSPRRSASFSPSGD
ncbi:ABC transporter [Streptomyces sp. NBC_01275]|uniref:ABC transporter n=1 Tax=Streptomyces sp. NBC_01275 TaxID=2903807 RepID=UPI00225688F7|nr:ABC transporter [Streptomyces sp. NBC_01275]MCX4763161.1 ABC transporter [Streptomyces sp. NBC_01275]